MVKAISLLSGGLDSILATKLVLQQGIEVEAINFHTIFCTCTPKNSNCLSAIHAADKLGIKVSVFEISQEYLDIVRNPKYGYGSQLNPCLDCRIFMFKKAKEYMQKVKASFIITGEVLGERPMSQRRDTFEIIEKETGLSGLILRPLSAKILPPTIPEKMGIIDRDKLMSISGRSRKPQISLAKNLGISDYPCPSGGCLLTDPNFARRMKDLIKYTTEISLNDVKLLRFGRHFRINPKAKFIVGRNEKENKILLNLARNCDIVLIPKNVKGPIGIGRGDFDKEAVFISSQLLASYCKKISEHVEIIKKIIPEEYEETIIVSIMERNKFEYLRI